MGITFTISITSLFAIILHGAFRFTTFLCVHIYLLLNVSRCVFSNSSALCMHCNAASSVICS